MNTGCNNSVRFASIVNTILAECLFFLHLIFRYTCVPVILSKFEFYVYCAVITIKTENKVQISLVNCNFNVFPNL